MYKNFNIDHILLTEDVNNISQGSLNGYTKDENCQKMKTVKYRQMMLYKGTKLKHYQVLDVTQHFSPLWSLCSLSGKT